MAGRRPKPLAIHRLNGDPSHLRSEALEGKDNPQPLLIEPEMPKGLPKAAKREWRNIVPLLKDLRVLSQIDGRALAEYCRAAALCEQAQKSIDKYGLMFVTHYEDKDGNLIPGDMKANPACAILATQQKVMKSYLIEFGLTPASRAKLKIEPKDDGNEMDQFMKRRTPSAPLMVPAKVDPSEMDPE